MNAKSIPELYVIAQAALQELGKAIAEQSAPIPPPVTDALADLVQIGTIDGNPLYKLSYQGGIWYASSPEPGVYMIHGSNLPANPAVILLTKAPSGIWGGSTDNLGRSQPAAFPADVPGYVAGAYRDKAKYFRRVAITVPDTTTNASTCPPVITSNMPMPDPTAEDATKNDQSAN